MKRILAIATSFVSILAFAEEKKPVFKAQTIDDKIEIGYAVTVADVDGDGKPDILCVDKKQIVWYQNPTWTKHVIAENLTEHDNVCIAARDIDGSGKCSIAVGAEWNPGDTLSSGAVFYLIPPADRTQKWEPVKFPSVEPTTHRMKWMLRDHQNGKPRYELVVVPLHGRGNKNGEGAGVKVLAYQMPKNPRDEWKSEVVCDDMHMTHNFFVHDRSPFLYLAGKEGIELSDFVQTPKVQGWGHSHFIDHLPSGFGEKGVGEVRPLILGANTHAPSAMMSDFGPHTQASATVDSYLATIEPMHGNLLIVYHGADNKKFVRTVLDSTLEEGHALACGDLLGLGRDQIVVGWRGAANNKLAKVGIKMFVPDWRGEKWTQHLIDDNTMACEDLVLADLNGDGKVDIIASGRRTKNVVIYWNQN